MIAHLLLLAFKQECEQISDEHKMIAEHEKTNTTGNIQNDSDGGVKSKTTRIYVRGLISMLGEGSQKYWKIGVHWLTVLNKSLLKAFDVNIALNLACYK